MSNQLIDRSISMNFLAHAFLAGPDPADRLGALLGDFVKGALPGGLPPAVASGVELHRRIDSFADTHPAFRQSRARVSPERRRYSGIMIDLFYDHFLALHWESFSDEPLEGFAAGVYALMAAHEALLPQRLGRILPLMRSQDWLAGYRAPEAIATALDRMAVHRMTRPNRLAGSGIELEARYREFEQDFQAFLPDAASFAAAFRRSRRENPSPTQHTS
jgi:acyl carrier protein phosphodiesterase